MSRKSFLTTSLLLPFVVVSTLAHAGPTITDKVYWPNEIRYPNANNPQPTDPYGARAMDTRAVPRAVEPKVDRSKPRYQGGPKSGLTN